MGASMANGTDRYRPAGGRSRIASQKPVTSGRRFSGGKVDSGDPTELTIHATTSTVAASTQASFSDKFGHGLRSAARAGFDGSPRLDWPTFTASYLWSYQFEVLKRVSKLSANEPSPGVLAACEKATKCARLG